MPYLPILTMLTPFHSFVKVLLTNLTFFNREPNI